jgi:hypothetical protein
MDYLRSIELWIAVQIGIDLCLIMLFLVAIRQVRGFKKGLSISQMEDVRKTIEPVLEDAKALANQFEAQLKEKQNIVRRLNNSLDDRVIGLNLLLKRAESCQINPVSKGDGGHVSMEVHQLQQEVIALSEKGMNPKKIAANLGIAKGEVDLVLDLKKKFTEMQQP